MRRASGRIAWALAVALGTATVASAAKLRPTTTETSAGRALVEALRAGGLVLFFRHADTFGMPCDSLFDPRREEGQRHLSPTGREQARAIGQRIEALRIPVQRPILAGPVGRARDTAFEAFGRDHVRVTDDLLADDFSGARLPAVLDAHRRLMSGSVAPGSNRVLVGHRTPAIMVLGSPVGGRALPEGGAIVLRPRPGGAPEILGILDLAPSPHGGFHQC